jgi:IPT/TIG domain
MSFQTLRRSFLVLLGLLVLPGCNNTLNPFCGSARPAPLITSLSPSAVTMTELQQGTVLTVNGSQFVSASTVIIGTKSLGPNVLSSQKLQVTLTSSVISTPGPVNVTVQTPSGNTSDLGCSSGGTSSALVLQVN